MSTTVDNRNSDESDSQDAKAPWNFMCVLMISLTVLTVVGVLVAIVVSCACGKGSGESKGVVQLPGMTGGTTGAGGKEGKS